MGCSHVNSLRTTAAEGGTQILLPKAKFSELIDGPAIDRDGNLYVCNLNEAGVIGIKKNPLDVGTAFEEWARLPDGGKPSSIRIDSKNQMFVTDFVKNRIYKFDLSKPHPFNAEKMQESIYFEDKENRLYQPNDLAIAEDGTIYLSDPPWHLPAKVLLGRLQPGEQPRPGNKPPGRIWELDTAGNLKLLITDLKTPNGIDLPSR